MYPICRLHVHKNSFTLVYSQAQNCVVSTRLVKQKRYEEIHYQIVRAYASWFRRLTRPPESVWLSIPARVFHAYSLFLWVAAQTFPEKKRVRLSVSPLSRLPRELLRRVYIYLNG
jgi:hypothetical protein